MEQKGFNAEDRRVVGGSIPSEIIEKILKCIFNIKFFAVWPKSVENKIENPYRNGFGGIMFIIYKGATKLLSDF